MTPKQLGIITTATLADHAAMGLLALQTHTGQMKGAPLTKLAMGISFAALLAIIATVAPTMLNGTPGTGQTQATADAVAPTTLLTTWLLVVRTPVLHTLMAGLGCLMLRILCWERGSKGPEPQQPQDST